MAVTAWRSQLPGSAPPKPSRPAAAAELAAGEPTGGAAAFCSPLVLWGASGNHRRGDRDARGDFSDRGDCCVRGDRGNSGNHGVCGICWGKWASLFGPPLCRCWVPSAPPPPRFSPGAELQVADVSLRNLSMLEMPSKLSGTSFPHCRISFRGAESVASLSSVWSAGLTTDATGCSISLRGAASIPSFKIPSSVWSARLITGAMLRCIFLRDSASMPAVAFSRLFCRPCFPRTAVVSFVAAACSANEDPNPVSTLVEGWRWPPWLP